VSDGGLSVTRQKRRELAFLQGFNILLLATAASSISALVLDLSFEPTQVPRNTVLAQQASRHVAAIAQQFFN
jgi:hypothetical protein